MKDTIKKIAAQFSTKDCPASVRVNYSTAWFAHVTIAACGGIVFSGVITF